MPYPILLDNSNYPKKLEKMLSFHLFEEKQPPLKILNSYRPISISSCLGKVSERMINNRLTWWLETTGFLHKNQAGFRAGHRTEDQLFRLSQKVIDGFQKKTTYHSCFCRPKTGLRQGVEKGPLFENV